MTPSVTRGRLAVLCAAIACAVPSSAAQDPATRRVQPDPRIEIRPIDVDAAATGPGAGRPAPDEPRAPVSQHDRALDVELDLAERRKRLWGEGILTPDFAATACVVAAGVAVLGLLLWAAKRRQR
jgi:hypothetical protein